MSAHDPRVDTFGERLRASREAKALSLTALAHRLYGGPGYVTAAHIGRYERGLTRSPSIDTVEALAKVLGVDVRWLLFGETGGPPDLDVPADPAVVNALMEAEQIMGKRLSQETRKTLLSMWPQLAGQVPTPVFFISALQALDYGTRPKGEPSED